MTMTSTGKRTQQNFEVKAQSSTIRNIDDLFAEGGVLSQQAKIPTAT